EPIFAIIGALLTSIYFKILPFALSFAAGAMIYVIIEEVIPETQKAENTDISTIFFIIGFLIMMILDTFIK
ncbi:MAG TPA: ZIP family metal transporter, partial [bacterium]|nr:ZIP family metal transporter [bacterium]